MNWLRDNVNARIAAETAKDWLRRGTRGWCGRKPPAAEDLRRLGELRWQKLDEKAIESFPEWMKRVYDDFAENDAFAYKKAMEILGQPMDRLNFSFLNSGFQERCLLDYGMFMREFGRVLDESRKIPEWLPDDCPQQGVRPC